MNSPDPESSPGPELAPPEPASSTGVDYPSGADGDAVVLLELTIGADGQVNRARVVDGDEPFATAAELAAKAWRFRPAKSNGQAVAAKIRVEVSFAAPSRDPAQDPDRRASGLGSATVEPANAVDGPEVLVEDDRPDPAAHHLGRVEVRQMPGAFGDPFRAIEAQPGVTPFLSGTPIFFVRGAPPGNVGYFLDGIPLPLLFHVATGPAVVPPGLIEGLAFYPGAYPARYGRAAGGILAAETVRPRAEWHGETTIRVLDAGAMVEAPFAGGRGTALVGGRHAYSAKLVSDLLNDVEYRYWDYQARVSYELSPRDRVQLFGFGSNDFLGASSGVFDDNTTFFDAEFHRIDVRYDRSINARSSARVGVTLGLDETRGDDDDFGKSRKLSVRARTDVHHRAGEHTTVRVGADISVADVDFRLPRNSTSLEDLASLARNFNSRIDSVIGTYVDAEFRVTPRITLNPGVRADLFQSGDNSEVGIDPRLSAVFELTPRVRTIHAVGISHQPPSFLIPVPGVDIAGLRGGLQRGVQTSSGVEADLPEKLAVGTTFFHNAIIDSSDPLSLLRIGVDDELDLRPLGRTVGVELSARRPLTERLGGFVSYTLSKSVRSFGRESGPGGFDRRHVLSAALGYDFGRRWRAGARYLYFTGGPAEVDNIRLARDPPRTRPFHRLDLRVEKRWPIGSAGAWIALVFEVLNATLSVEEVGLKCEQSVCESDEFGPLTVPSVGLEAAF